MSERTQEPFGALPEWQRAGAAQEPPAKAAPGEGQAAEHPAENEPEMEEEFSAERLLRELEAALRDDVWKQKMQEVSQPDGSGPEDGPEDPDGEEEAQAEAEAGPALPAELPAAEEPPVPGLEAPASQEPFMPGTEAPALQESAPAKTDAPSAAQTAAGEQAPLTLQGLLEDLETSEQADHRKKKRGTARAEKKPRRFRRGAAVFFILLLAAAVAAFRFVGFAVINGAPMTASLSGRDFLVYWKFPGEIGRGEVLLFRSEGYGDRLLAKRVIGLPGEVVEVNKDGLVLLGGEQYVETTAVYGASELASDVRFPIRVQEDCYFVLGDNRAASVDSRQSAIGQIARQDVLGRVLYSLSME